MNGRPSLSTRRLAAIAIAAILLVGLTTLVILAAQVHRQPNSGDTASSTTIAASSDSDTAQQNESTSPLLANAQVPEDSIRLGSLSLSADQTAITYTYEPPTEIGQAFAITFPATGWNVAEDTPSTTGLQAGAFQGVSIFRLPTGLSRVDITLTPFLELRDLLPWIEGQAQPTITTVDGQDALVYTDVETGTYGDGLPMLGDAVYFPTPEILVTSQLRSAFAADNSTPSYMIDSTATLAIFKSFQLLP
jgi:hypothetical protein